MKKINPIPFKGMLSMSRMAFMATLVLLVTSFTSQAQSSWYVNDATAENGWAVGNNALSGNSIGSPKATIQAAINAAAPGDIIYVGTGTFNTPFSVTKSLTIRGINYQQSGPTRGPTAADESIITGARAVISINANNVTIEGFRIVPTSSRIMENPNGTGLTLTNNVVIVNGSRNPTYGIFDARMYNISGLNISGNLFQCTSGTGGFIPVYLVRSTGSLVVDNATISNNAFVNTAHGIYMDRMGVGSMANVSITNNTFDNIQGVSTGTTGGGRAISANGLSNSSISGNTFNNVYYFGLQLGASNTVSVSNNNFTGSSINGVRVITSMNNVVVNNNNFSGNFSQKAIVNAVGSGVLDATCNWLGANSATATADAVTASGAGSVSYSPWLINNVDDDANAAGFQPQANTCIGGASTLAIDYITADEIYCESTGSAEIAFTGGVAPFTISWPGGSETNASSPFVIPSLPPGTHNIVITDANSASVNSNVTLVAKKVYNASWGIAYSSLQAAIDAASPGDVITLCSGTYAEKINIGKSLTILGPNANISPNTDGNPSLVNATRYDEAIIKPNETNGALLTATASGISVVMKGIVFDRGNGTEPYASFVHQSGRTGNSWVLENNIFRNAPETENGYFLFEGAVTGMSFNFNNNRLQNNGVSNGISLWGFSPINVAINNNVWYNNSGWSLNVNSIQGTINNNYFVDGRPAAFDSVWYTVQNGFVIANDNNNLTVNGNVFNNLHSGINIYRGDDGANNQFGGTMAISNNSFQQLKNYAIRGGNTPYMPNLTNVTIHNNSFINAKLLNVDNTFAMNATCNWFGSLNAQTIASGISGNVSYSPWLVNGTDEQPATMGFQPGTGLCTGTAPTISSLTQTAVAVCLNNIGAISATFANGTAPYSITLNAETPVANVTSPYAFNNLAPGTYTVTITDVNGSTVSSTVVVNLLPVVVKNETTSTLTGYSTIQDAINASSNGDSVYVCAGTYNENVTINKSISLFGISRDSLTGTIIAPNSGNGIEIAVSNVNVKNLYVKRTGRLSGVRGINLGSVSDVKLENVAVSGCSYGVEVNTSAVYNLTMENVAAFDNNVGFRVASGGSVEGMTVNHSNFDGNDYGFYTKVPSSGTSVDNQNKFQNITIYHSTFNKNAFKGIYVEKLHNATLRNIVVDSSAYGFFNPNGIDLNLKRGFYGNIVFDSIYVKNSGNGAINGNGIAIKGRNDAPSYSTYPGTLTNLTLNNVLVNGSPIDLAIGNGVSGVVMDSVVLEGNGYGMIVYGIPNANPASFNLGNTNFSSSLSGYLANSSNTAVLTATDAIFGGVNAGATLTNENAYLIADKVYDNVDTAIYGRVILKNNQVYVTTNSYIAPSTVPSINRGILAASVGDTVNVASGNYLSNVVVNKNVTLKGAGIDQTIISGPKGGNVQTIKVETSAAIIENMTITREGNNLTDWNDGTLNSAGVAIQSQGNAAEVRYCKITGNRTGIDINNSNGNNIHDNIIDNNRTGMIFRNQTDNTTVTNNDITNNWTVGIVFLDASSGSNSPVQSAANSTFSNNNISGNWYAQIEDRQSGGSLPAPGSNMKNFECNWFGLNAVKKAAVTAGEPSYASQIPVAFGGSAVAPAQTVGQICGVALDNVDFEPWLVNGVDDNANTAGFQPANPSCIGVSLSLTVNALDSVIKCKDEEITIVDVTINGGVPPYTINFDGSIEITNSTAFYTDTVGTPGLHTLVITDAIGSNTSLSYTLVEPAQALTLTATPVHPKCASDLGAIMLNATGGTSPIAVDINGGVYQDTDTATAIDPGNTYTVIATDANGCTVETEVSIDAAPDVLVFDVSTATDALCAGLNGNLTFGASGGSGTINYYLTKNIDSAWKQINTLGVDTVAGTYIIKAVDANNCSVSTTLTINQPLGISIVVSNLDNAKCFGEVGSFNLRGVGGTAIDSTGFTYEVDGDPYNFSGAFYGNSGVYTVVVTDAINTICSVSTVVTITEPDLLEVNVSTTDVACFGGNGTLSYTVTGGTSTYSIDINSGVFSDASKVLFKPADTYTVSVTDANYCTAETVVVITQPAEALTFNSASSTSPDCFGQLGIITFEAQGGTGIIKYSIGNSSVVSPHPVPTGTYVVMATDANYCTADTAILLQAPTQVEFSPIIVTHLDCFGDANGSIEFEANGGTGGKNYSVNGSPDVSPIESLTAGIYTIVATDENSCTAVTTVLVNQPNNIVITSDVTNPSCNSSNGTVTLSATGGNGSFSFTVGNNSPSASFNGGSGTYTVNVTDAKQCSASATFTITEPTPVVLTASNTNAPCKNGEGTLTFSATGGAGNYTYTVNGNPNNTGSMNAPKGSYSIIATDSSGCSTSTILEITEPALLELSATASNAPCNGANGSITFSATGGTSPYTFKNGNTTIESPLATLAGSYTVTVIDSNGCSTSNTTLTIGQPSALSFGTATVTNALCYGGNGQLTYSVSGGTGTKTYTVNNAASTSPSTLVAGTYTVNATDANNCSISTIMTVTQPDLIVLTASKTDAPCKLENASLTFSAIGGTGTLTYTVNNNAQVSPYNVAAGTYTVAAGTYTVAVTDINNCSKDTVISVSEPDLLTINSNVSNAACFGSNGSITFSANGGTANYAFKVNGTTATTPYTAAAGTYTIAVTDSKNCSTTTEVTVTQPNLITTSQTASACYSYTWPVSNTTYTVTGNYTHTLTANAGCDSVVTLNLTITPYSFDTTTVVSYLTYTWPVNNQTYTVSNQYVDTSSVNGSPSCTVRVLKLTITTCKEPINLTATPAQQAAAISWAMPTGTSAPNYAVQVAPAGTNNWSAEQTTSNLSFNFTGLTSNTAYDYRVRALCGTNSVSEWVAGSFTTNVITCATPTFNTSTAGLTTATVSWSNTGAGSYILSWKAQGTSTWSTATVSGTQIRNLTGLTAGTTYDVKVYGFCLNEVYSDTAFTTFTTTAPCGNISYTSNTPARTTIRLDWTAVPGAISYTSQRRGPNDASFTSAATNTNLNRTFTGLTANTTTYTLRVRANCPNSNSGAFNEVVITTTAAKSAEEMQTAYIVNFYGEMNAEGNNLMWSTATENNCQEMVLEHSTNGSDYSDIARIRSLADGGTSEEELNYGYLHKDAPFGVNYYRLKSINLDGTRAYHKDIVTLTKEVPAANVRVYPNPTKDLLNLDFNAAQQGQVRVKILDMTGRVVKVVQVQVNQGENSVGVGIGEFPQGIYTIQMIQDNQLLHVSKIYRKD